MVDLSMFVNSTGYLADIAGTDPARGPWKHKGFVPHALTSQSPELTGATHLEIANARAALAALDTTARQLPNPQLLRQPTLRREAQSTSALEGTYEPLGAVLVADEDEPATTNLREILNYVRIADEAFVAVSEGRPITIDMLCAMQGQLVAGTSSDSQGSGDVRAKQVVIGRREDAGPGQLPVEAARFVPGPPGDQLRSNLTMLLDWMRDDHSGMIDPVVSAGMSHYQFETLHPFEDGNGRLGRLLVVVYLHAHSVLSEPTLTVSPWFEARRAEYYDRLLAVSAHGDWDGWIQFFARGLRESADLTHRQMMALVGVQDELKEVVRASRLRADNALLLIDHAVANPSFTVRSVQRSLSISYGRANGLVTQLSELGVLEQLSSRGGTTRRFYAPRVLDAIIGIDTGGHLT